MTATLAARPKAAYAAETYRHGFTMNHVVLTYRLRGDGKHAVLLCLPSGEDASDSILCDTLEEARAEFALVRRRLRQAGFARCGR